MILLLVFVAILVALAAKPAYNFIASRFKNRKLSSAVKSELSKQVAPYQLQELQEILLTPGSDSEINSSAPVVDSTVEGSTVVDQPVKKSKRKVSVKKKKASKKKTVSKTKPSKKKVSKKKD